MVADNTPLTAQLVAWPHPLRSDRLELAVPEGATLAEIVVLARLDPMLARHAQLWLCDSDQRSEPWPVPRVHWSRVRPRAGTIVQLRVVPSGGGGGKVLRTVLQIAVIVASVALTAAGGPLGGIALFGVQGLGSTLIAAGINLVGGLLINALIPPVVPKLDLGNAGGGRFSNALSLTGTSNRTNLYGPVPRIYGRVRAFPVKAARDFSESQGEIQFLRCLFDFGYGPLDISDLRIGTTPIGQFDGVEMELRPGRPDDPPITLYPAALREDGYALRVTHAGGPQVVESRDNASELILDLTWNGLVAYQPNGSASVQAVRIRLEYRALPAGDWTLWAEEDVAAASPGRYTRGYRVKPASPGRFAVRITRLSADSTATTVRDEMFLTALRSVEATMPVRATGRCLLALRIQATDQLNGTVDQLSAIAQALLPVWDGSAWSEPQATRAHAWAYADVLRGAANARPVADARLDLPALLDWAARSDADGADAKHTFDAVIDYETTVFEALRDIAASGRAAPGMRDGRFSIVQDLPQSVPIQHFTPRNSWGFRGSKAFTEQPHGVRVRYVEPDRDWTQQEITVYADGFDEATATRIDSLETFGCTRKEQAKREGRYHLAAARLRPEVYELSCDIENLLVTRGDLVRVSHDVPLWGSGWGRVTSVTLDGDGRIAGFALDEPVPVRADRSYAVRIRRGDATSLVASIAAEPGEATAFGLLVPVPEAEGFAPGDLAMIGEAERETAPLIVKAIVPGPDLTAKLVLVDAAPAIHDADQGAIPAFDPLLTQPYAPPRRTPGEPVVAEVFSGNAALLRAGDGSILSRIGVRLRAAPLDREIGGFQLRWRAAGSGAAWEVSAGPGPVLFTAPVLDGVAYEVSARAIAVAGAASPWTDTAIHTVEGKAALPSDVAVFLIAGRRLDWSSVPDLDLAGYRIRWNRGTDIAWGSAAPLHGGLLTASPFTMDAAPSGRITLLIKAVDTGGRESANATAILTDLGDAALEGEEAAARDFYALAWPGVIVGASAVGGDLLAEADGGTAMWAGDALPMWGDPDAPMFDDRWMAMSYEDEVAFADPPPGARVLLRETIEGESAAVEWMPSRSMWGDDGDPIWGEPGDPMWPAGQGEWAAWPGALPASPGFLLRVTIAGGPVRGGIRRLRAVLDAPRITEALADVDIASTGTRLPIQRSYRAISTVQLTIQGGTGRSVVVADKDRSLGPLVRAFDLAGTAVAATVDATITGY
jgi:hypothetical protein